MELVDYEPAHLDTLVSDDAENIAELRINPDWAGKAVSAREDGRTLGIFGVGVTAGYANCWLILSDDMRHRRVSLCRLAQDAVRGLREMGYIPFGECHDDRSRRFADWLGVKHG